MNLNLLKCHLTLFTRRRFRMNFLCQVGDTFIDRAHEILDLGVLLTEKIDMNAHINFAVAKAPSVLGLV